MPTITSPAATLTTQVADAFFPSGYFAKVPAEALGPLAFEGPHRMEHAEFHLLVALCRFRGRARVVNPGQETLAKMTGMTRNNVSRAAHGLQAKGWVRLHHKDNNPHKPIENYELLIPTPGISPGVAPKPRKAHAKPVDAATSGTPRTVTLVPMRQATSYPAPLDGTEFDAIDHEAVCPDEADIDSEPMSKVELDEALVLIHFQT